MLFRGASIGVLLVCISGCKFAGAFAKEALVAASSDRGWETFIFKGQLPAEFGIDAYALYSPDEPDKASCQSPTFDLDKTETRRHSQQYTAAISDKPQAFSFDIPLSYSKGLCGMKLSRVVVDVNARYGPQKWQTTYASHYLYISDVDNERISLIGSSDVLYMNSECSFTFQESKIYLSLSKFIGCKDAGAYLMRKNLNGKKIILNITISPKEEPAQTETWIRFPNGWKPCAHKDGWRWCRDPIEFKTFQMNGQTCTVYPGCTE